MPRVSLQSAEIVKKKSRKILTTDNKDSAMNLLSWGIGVWAQRAGMGQQNEAVTYIQILLFKNKRPGRKETLQRGKKFS